MPWSSSSPPPESAGSARHSRTDRAGIREGARFLNGAMIPMIETDAYQRSGVARGFRYGIQLRGEARARLLNENMLARAGGFRGDGREHIVSGGGDRDVDVRRGDGGAPIRGSRCAWMCGGQRFRARGIQVATYRQACAGQRFRALTPDQAASGYGDIEGHPRSTC